MAEYKRLKELKTLLALSSHLTLPLQSRPMIAIRTAAQLTTEILSAGARDLMIGLVKDTEECTTLGRSHIFGCINGIHVAPSQSRQTS